MNAQRFELFPTIVHCVGLSAHAEHYAGCMPALESLFARAEAAKFSSPMEVGDALSTFPIDRNLYLRPEFEVLADDLLRTTAAVTGFDVAFVEMWANRHRRGGRTLEHMHGAQVCGAYYLSAPEDGGGLIFRSPLEYALCGTPQVDASECRRTDGVAHRLDVGDGMLVVFPGWLKHLTEESNSAAARIVISFNLRIVGLHVPETEARSHSA